MCSGVVRVLTFAVSLCFLVSNNGYTKAHQDGHQETIHINMVQGWAVKLGTELWLFGDYITRRNKVQDSFKQAQIEQRDGKKLVENMAADIHAMMELKISAVKRIVDAAENMALSKAKDEVPSNFQYYNSKDMKEPYSPEFPTSPPHPMAEDESDVAQRPPSLDAHLLTNPHFSGIAVNTNFSSVHVPTNVYDWAPEVIKGISWSQYLDSIFVNNYRSDPSLSWQYFGSSTGFMRHYPAMKWRAEPVDIYDCRSRAWYVEAAASPKDVIILVDRSGSMTGQRRDIAKHVVSNILDTLGNNDFVNVFTFAETVEEVVPCFEDSLVQATLGNLRELKLGLENFNTMEIANFSAALTRAFDLLQSYREDRHGACCNQAIMLVTDGVPYNYKEIFELYNWPEMPVRVFTYLIGREVADVREVKWMACANRGYYVHLSTLAEVRERVLEHLSVLARPLVLQRDYHPVVWTPVYANITDPKIGDYLWDMQEREEQKERFMSQRKDKTLFNSRAEQDRRFVMKQMAMKQGQYSEVGYMPYQLMTSISIPVYDRRDYENITENVLINEAYWVTVTKETVEDPGPKEVGQRFEASRPDRPPGTTGQTGSAWTVRIANLLGVAGTDMPLQEIEALMTPHKLGVNGYAFIVTNNGYILIHPDLRPVFQQILKPSYNSIDMVEVELMDDDHDPRDFSAQLLQFRRSVIDQKSGSTVMPTKYHLDDMKRVSRITRHYYWKGIPNSPFTLVLTLPKLYGLHRLVTSPTDDIHRTQAKGFHALQYFPKDGNWQIHPEWLYCRHYLLTFPNPEAELKFFLDRMRLPGWHWPLKPKPPEHLHGNSSTRTDGKSEKDNYYCDHGLVQALVNDARVTWWFNQTISSSNNDDKSKELIQRFGITVVFLATHSGLTRWQNLSSPSEPDHERNEFGKLWPRTIDETWYKRAVEQHFVEPMSFVYSTPLNNNNNARNYSDSLITAAHAVFHTDKGQSAPAAVVGFQFRHDRLVALFTNITSSCGENINCRRTCQSPDLDCLIVDNNGWVVVSKTASDVGRFLGEVSPMVMGRLVEEQVYQAVHVVDYQAVCFRHKKTTNPAANLFTPLDNLRHLLSWAVASTIWLWNSFFISVADGYGFAYSNDEAELYNNYEVDMEQGEMDGEEGDADPSGDIPARIKERDFDKLVLINRTRPTPCDREMTLYQLQTGEKAKLRFQTPADGCNRPFVVQHIPGTNLLLLVVDSECLVGSEHPVLRVDPAEVQYNGSLPCLRHLRPLYRRQPISCINNHTNESSIDMCGSASSLYSSLLLCAAVIIYFSLATQIPNLDRIIYI